MSQIIQLIGLLCCAVVMGVAALFGVNYLEANIWWFYVFEPVLIVLAMGGCLCASLRKRVSAASVGAVLLFCMTVFATGALTKRAFDYGEQISEERAHAENVWAVEMWNKNAPSCLKVSQPTSTTYMDRVGVAGILLLRKYGNDIYHIGYFELNLLLYALLFPGIALLFAVLWLSRKCTAANYCAIIICVGTLLTSLYLFHTLPLKI